MRLQPVELEPTRTAGPGRLRIHRDDLEVNLIPEPEKAIVCSYSRVSTTGLRRDIQSAAQEINSAAQCGSGYHQVVNPALERPLQRFSRIMNARR